MSPRELARLAGAIAFGAFGASLLVSGGARPAVAAVAGLGAATFVLWRSVPGVCAAFALLAAAALLAWRRDHSAASLASILPWALVLEAYGLLTVAAVARSRDPRRISRRLLGSFLATSGAGLLGLALLSDDRALAAGSALVAGALSYRVGAAPAYAWVPLLLRHPRPPIRALGILGMALTALLMLRWVPLLPDHRAAGFALALLAAATLPWAAVRAVRQWPADPQCARTYTIVAGVSLAVLIIGIRLWSV